ncbi:hypothetical protein AB0F11_21135 [Streptomyces sp. NPDC032472]|uniref:hypothetical protein n=1 Tax=Streptomyces sp. NPDC032472 TaxID=3155018 RepID=UPI0033D4DB1A
MDAYRRMTELIESAWKELAGAETGRRDLCLDVVGDVLETGRLVQKDAEPVVERLVAVALSDELFPVRESALHAVCGAAMRYELPYRVVEPLADVADGIEPLLLGYVLAALGATHDEAALPTVERFLGHPHPGVREEAAHAAEELRWCPESATALHRADAARPGPAH